MTDQRIATQKKKLLFLLRREIFTHQLLDALTEAVRAKLQAAHGLQFGDTSKTSKRVKLTKTLLLSVARECLETTTLGVPTSVRLAIFPVEDVDKDEQPSPSPLGASSTRGAGGVSFDIPSSDRSKKNKPDIPHWKLCQQELYQYWHLLDGREKLAHPTRPSTAICGNAALLFAMERIVQQEAPRVFGATRDTNIEGELFIGRSPGNVTCRIGHVDDSADVRDATWRQLWSAYSCDNTVLVYHMKNHYALIFALREWRSCDGHVQRELLTARRGQRPSSWVHWQEAYETMVAWHGYKILRFTSIIDTSSSQ